jgi:two-component system response regulator HydG
MLKQSAPVPSCRQPFEQGARLCRFCALGAGGPGLHRCSRLVAESGAMRALLRRAAPVAASEASVVVVGETGSGKEVLARALHANSRRATAPFLAVNVAALPAPLLESELFGHVRGAFTGATTAKAGLFEAASGGTLFLDEIAEMPHELQAKLLRVLQDGEVRRVGDVRPFSVDVRVVCATHQDLRRTVLERRFREDLYYRLKVFQLFVPPLRERRDDILPLARMFLSEHDHPGRLSAPAERALLAYPWPGNVRELANAIEHGAALSESADVDLQHLPEEVVRPERLLPTPGSLRTLAEIERAHVLHVLEACGGHQGEAARILGIGRTTLWRKLRALGVAA